MVSVEYRIRRAQLYVWVVAAIVSPVLSAAALYYGTKMDIQELRNEIESHEEMTQVVVKQAEATHLMFNSRLTTLETGDKEIEKFIAMIKGKLNL